MNTIRNIGINDIDRYVGDSRYVILDVRSEAAYKRGHVQGAINIPYVKLERMGWELYSENKLSIRLDREKIYVIYCEHGGVSITAARMLARKGYQVINTIGGMASYKKR